jgi:hypothetical protein
MAAAALAFPVAACSSEAQALPEVPSLRDALPGLEAAALAWRDDAYLEDVEIQVPGPSWLTSYISAGFRSQSAGQEAALVFLDLDGSTRVEILQDGGPPSPEDAIRADDLSLDAPEALELALDDAGRTFLEESTETQCSFMQLTRSSRISGDLVVWRLVLKPCLLGDPVQEVTIDAVTGEVLERR